jgi:hypothetical protein
MRAMTTAKYFQMWITNIISQELVMFMLPSSCFVWWVFPSQFFKNARGHLIEKMGLYQGIATARCCAPPRHPAQMPRPDPLPQTPKRRPDAPAGG